MTLGNWGINTEWEDFDKLLRSDDIEEEPVPLETFLHEKKYLGLEHDLSEVQMELIRHMTQIYKLPTLIKLHGEEKGLQIYNDYTVNEVIAEIGKGGGKDFSSRAAFCYIIYQLHCLRDPLNYYGKAHGTYIEMLNVAVNAQQAQRVFFDPFKNLLLASPYFNDVGFDPRVNEIHFFQRPIRCYSGHSEAEGWEGYDLLMVVLDEIAAFKTDAELKGETRSKGSATAIYQMSKPSVMSRFPEVGKVVLLSFPRFKGDFIQQRMEAFTSGQEEKTWGVIATTWESNPTITREMLEPEFRRNEVEANMRFACIPPEMTDAYFREPDLVRAAFLREDDPRNEDGTYKQWFTGSDGFQRFIHVDLAQLHDHAALCMVHCIGMKEVETGHGITETLPIIKMDYIEYWSAESNAEIPFDDIRNRILELARKFSVAVVSFDEWQSVDMAQSLRSKGVNVDKLTIRKPQYDTLATTFYDKRFRGYWNEFLVEEELLKLRIINNVRVDHGSKGFKDGADALAGAAHQCMIHLDTEVELEIEIWDNSVDNEEVIEEIRNPKSIEPKTPAMPVDLEEWLLETL
jgi:hypothetical protein